VADEVWFHGGNEPYAEGVRDSKDLPSSSKPLSCAAYSTRLESEIGESNIRSPFLPCEGTLSGGALNFPHENLSARALNTRPAQYRNPGILRMQVLSSPA